MPTTAPITTASDRITVRRAVPADRRALGALAQLDSATLPAEPLLVAEVDGRLQAALSLDGGAAVADPFEPTEHLVVLLKVHASLLAEERRARRTARAPLHALKGLSPRALLRAP